MTDLPKYECHEVVSALQIISMEFAPDGSARLVGAGYGTRYTSPGFQNLCGAVLHNVDGDLGYYVLPGDGIERWVSTEDFCKRYERI